MNSVKITYIICSVIGDLAMLLIMILAPLYVTPGYYWWSAAMFIMLSASSCGFTKRVNTWKDMGNI